MQQCKTCNGTYPDVQADGTRYFHACPPLSDAEVKTALALPADDAVLTKLQRDQVAAAPRARANARDENITTTAPSKTAAPMKAPGAGVTTVP